LRVQKSNPPLYPGGFFGFGGRGRLLTLAFGPMPFEARPLEPTSQTCRPTAVRAFFEGPEE